MKKKLQEVLDDIGDDFEELESYIKQLGNMIDLGRQISNKLDNLQELIDLIEEPEVKEE